MKSSIVKRSMVVGGHKTSVSLEDAFWDRLREIAGQRGERLSQLITNIDADRQDDNLSSAIRLFVLASYRDHLDETVVRSSTSTRSMVWYDRRPSIRLNRRVW